MAKYDKRPDNSQYKKDNKDQKTDQKATPPSPKRGLFVSVIMLVLFVVLLNFVMNSAEKKEAVSYTKFLTMVKNKRVATVKIQNDGSGNYYVTGESKDPDKDGSTKFKVNILLSDKMLDLLNESGVDVEVQKPKTHARFDSGERASFHCYFYNHLFCFYSPNEKCGAGGDELWKKPRKNAFS